MTARVVVCPDCAAQVPYGRLSCSACGSLLASVGARSRRSDASETVPHAGAPLPQSATAAPEPVADPLDSAAPGDAVPAVPESIAAAPESIAAYASIAMPAGAWLPPSAMFDEPRGDPVEQVPQAIYRSRDPRQSPPRPGQAGLLADLPLQAPDELAGWLVAAGAGFGTAGFVLPWADVVIGAAAMGGYLDQWGLANPAHLPIFAFSLGVLGLAVVPNRVPGWLRTGVLALVLGGMVLGLAWPYLLARLGPGPGTYAELLAAVLLLTGGALASFPSRRESDPPSV